MNRDRYDLPLTTASDRAAAHYRDGVDCMLSAWHGAEGLHRACRMPHPSREGAVRTAAGLHALRPRTIRRPGGRR